MVTPRNALTQFIVDAFPGEGTVLDAENQIVSNRFLQGQIDTLTLPPTVFRQVDWPQFGDGKKWVDAGIDEMKLSLVSVNFSTGFFGILGKNIELRVSNGLFSGQGVRDQGTPWTRQLVTCRGPIMGVTPGEQKPGELAKLTIEQMIEYYKVEEGSYVPLIVDMLNIERWVDGVDQLAPLTGAFGL